LAQGGIGTAPITWDKLQKVLNEPANWSVLMHVSEEPSAGGYSESVASTLDSKGESVAHGTRSIKGSQNFTVTQLRAFVRAAESLSFSKAALGLGMTQPALSRCIREMERAMSCDLFVRASRGVALTAAGSALVSRARLLLNAYTDMLAFVSRRDEAQSGTFRLAVSPSAAPVIWDAFFRLLRRDAPGVEPFIAIMPSDDGINELLANRVDVVLCGDVGSHNQLRYTQVLSAPLGLLVPPACCLPKVIRCFDDLAGLSIIRLAENTPITRTLVRHQVEFPSYFKSPIVFDSLSLALDRMRKDGSMTVASGIGASLPETQDMRFVPLPDLLPTLQVFIASSRQLTPDVRLERLRDLVRQSIHESPWHESVERRNQMHIDGP